MEKANMDIRQYMADHAVTQRVLAEELGISQTKVFKMLSTELSTKEKEKYLFVIDTIVSERGFKPDENTNEEVVEDTTCTTNFQIGDRVKIPSKSETIGIVTDIWASMAQNRTLYEVTYEGNSTKGLYAEDQFEPAPNPTTYTFETKIDGNVAVVAMIAKQGDETWVYARGHAHILHNGEVGLAQAISYAARRMFESLDSKQENRIYFKEQGVAK